MRSHPPLGCTDRSRVCIHKARELSSGGEKAAAYSISAYKPLILCDDSVDSIISGKAHFELFHARTDFLPASNATDFSSDLFAKYFSIIFFSDIRC